MEHIIYIEFGKSRSANYRKALSIAKGLPGYGTKDDTHIICIDELKDYLIHQDAIMEVIDTIRKWKNSRVLFYGRQYITSLDYEHFIYELERNAGKYSEIVRSRDTVSLGAVTIENLPLPIVFYPGIYGSFFAFAEDIDEQVFFCECEKEAINNFITLRNKESKNEPNDTSLIVKKEFPTITYDLIKSCNEDLISNIPYRKGLCFRCNGSIPRRKYCHPMYGGKFVQSYGWYINQEYYKLGIDKRVHEEIRVLPEQCSPEIYDTTQRINELLSSRVEIHDNEEKIIKLRKSLNRAIENSVREQLGFRKIGDAWVSETLLYNIVKELYPGEEIIRHYRPKWLEGLEIDIFIPRINTGLEYQGIQHFKAVEHWGGEAQLENQKEHDMRKKKLCKELGVKLVCVNYDEPITLDYISVRMKEND